MDELVKERVRRLEEADNNIILAQKKQKGAYEKKVCKTGEVLAWETAKFRHVEHTICHLVLISELITLLTQTTLPYRQTAMTLILVTMIQMIVLHHCHRPIVLYTHPLCPRNTPSTRTHPLCPSKTEFSSLLLSACVFSYGKLC